MKKKKFWKIFGITILVLVAAGGVYAFTVYRSVRDMMNEAHIDLDRETIRDEELVLGERDEDGNIIPFSVLLLGIDRDHPNDRGRSDSMMLVTVNPNEGSTNVLSIQRDSRVAIPGRGTTRINHAYAYGGPALAIETVENFLNVPIDYFVTIDMDGIQALVDAVGGITVYNDTIAFSQDGHHFSRGDNTLNGSAALAFSRNRSDTDFGRMARQRLVLDALISRLASTAVTRFQPIMDAVGANMTTDLLMDDIITMSTTYLPAMPPLGEINMTDLQGHGGIADNGMWLLSVPEYNRLEATNRMREHLGLELE